MLLDDLVDAIVRAALDHRSVLHSQVVLATAELLQPREVRVLRRYQLSLHRIGD